MKSENEAFEEKNKSKETEKLQSTEAQLLKRIRELEHHVTYLEQENSFLKKIQKLEREYVGRTAKKKRK